MEHSEPCPASQLQTDSSALDSPVLHQNAPGQSAQSNLRHEELETEVEIESTGLEDFDQIWADKSFYSLGDIIPPDPVLFSEALHVSRANDLQQINIPYIDDRLLALQLPVLFPSLPQGRSSLTFVPIQNPFIEGSEERHATLTNRFKPRLPESGVVDGYVKFRISEKPDDVLPAIPLKFMPFSRKRTRDQELNNSVEGNHSCDAIPPLPPNFATGIYLDQPDEKAWVFYLTAYCPGRMLVQHNWWRDDVLPIAVVNDCVRHAVLAFGFAYILDYLPTERIRQRANRHYRKAVQLLSEELRNPESYEVGKDDGIVAAMTLLHCHDVVNWEEHRSKDREPLWLEGARHARHILDRSDPGWRYWHPHNVQSSVTRTAQANWVAYVEICAHPVTPLPQEGSNERLYGWLLEGTKLEVHRIHGMTGVCPKLLHMFAQITSLCATSKRNPFATAPKLGADRLLQHLENFWQWSDLSPGHPTPGSLYASCIVDDSGVASDRATVTELTAHSWVPAAQIYLHCRFYRKPIRHTDVQQSLRHLIRCVSLLPCTGPLFTSQSPLLPVFIMAVASYTEKDRATTRQWFETILGGAQCRSSLPPVWDAVTFIWSWLDKESHFTETYSPDIPLHERQNWWERMVEAVVEKLGIVGLN